MKYPKALFYIWKNFFTGRNKLVLYAICFIACFSIAIGFLHNIFVGLVAIYAWFFFLPCAIFAIDHDREKNPNRPKTLGNLYRILSGK